MSLDTPISSAIDFRHHVENLIEKAASKKITFVTFHDRSGFQSVCERVCGAKRAAERRP